MAPKTHSLMNGWAPSLRLLLFSFIFVFLVLFFFYIFLSNIRPNDQALNSKCRSLAHLLFLTQKFTRHVRWWTVMKYMLFVTVLEYIFQVFVLYSSGSVLEDFTFTPLHFNLKYPTFYSTMFVQYLSLL